MFVFSRKYKLMNEIILLTCKSTRYKYLLRLSLYLRIEIKHNSNCSSCVLKRAGCSPWMPKTCRSSNVNARPLFRRGSRMWSIPCIIEGQIMSPHTSWYPRSNDLDLLTASPVTWLNSRWVWGDSRRSLKIKWQILKMKTKVSKKKTKRKQEKDRQLIKMF